MNYIKSLLEPLILTVLIEWIILIILKEKRKLIFLVSFLLNIITNISLNICLLKINFADIYIYFLCLILSEIAIFIIEGFGYFIFLKEKKKSIFYSLWCNGTSFIVGLVLGIIISIL
ncbi:MAG: hypothetical protein K2I77_00550 [Anaeroplasmataceae bacterium]|nr:hypothetical protein [Anaeroplasmataceae bacterium]